jgi:hypothetical protein
MIEAAELDSTPDRPFIVRRIRKMIIVFRICGDRKWNIRMRILPHSNDINFYDIVFPCLLHLPIGWCIVVKNFLALLAISREGMQKYEQYFENKNRGSGGLR